MQIWSSNLCIKVRQQAGCMRHQRFWLPCPAAKPLLNIAYYIYPLCYKRCSSQKCGRSHKRSLHLCFSMAGNCMKASDFVFPFSCPSAMWVFQNAAGFVNLYPLWWLLSCGQESSYTGTAYSLCCAALPCFWELYSGVQAGTLRVLAVISTLIKFLWAASPSAGAWWWKVHAALSAEIGLFKPALLKWCYVLLQRTWVSNGRMESAFTPSCVVSSNARAGEGACCSGGTGSAGGLQGKGEGLQSGWYFTSVPHSSTPNTSWRLRQCSDGTEREDTEAPWV